MRNFSYSPGSLSALKAALTPQRLKPYTDRTGTLSEAIDLYVWNELLASALLGPLRAAEIALRNGLHAELAKMYGANWYRDSSFDLNARRAEPKKTIMREISDSVRYLNRSRVAYDAFDVSASLNFGFWTTLLDPIFEPIFWSPGLHLAFPNYKTIANTLLTRSVVAKRFDAIRKLRNRISHNEPLIGRMNLLSEYEQILEGVEWMNLDMAPWIDHHSTVRFAILLRERPRYFI